MEHGADPRRLPDDAGEDYDGHLRYVHAAIRNGDAEILTMMLDYGASVGLVQGPAAMYGQALLVMLRDEQMSRNTKVNIVRILNQHAKTKAATAEYLQVLYKPAIDHMDECTILLEAGTTPGRRDLRDASVRGNVNIWRLFVQFGIDPFCRYDGDDDDDGAASSPFHTAAQQTNTAVLEFFVALWNKRFACTGGRNSNGDAPIDIICRDPRVTITAVTLLVQTFDANLSTTSQRSFPFQSAIKVNANLDVIYYLLNIGRTLWIDRVACSEQ